MPFERKDTRIVFLGTPEFAAASLKALLQSGYSLVAVVTAPDKPAGRGMKPSESAVKQFALARGIPVLQPLKLKDPEFIAALAALRADIQVVVAFRMLPQQVWNMPPQGTVNLHASLLPQYRGAAPINRAIMEGETETGLTTFKLQQEIDTGPILLTHKMPIGPNETAGELHDRMKTAGAGLLLETIDGLRTGSIQEQPQIIPPGLAIRQAPKIFASDCEINWNRPVADIHNQIRGLSPYPGAFSFLQGKSVKLFRSRPETAASPGVPGSIGTDGRSWLRFAGNDGYIYVEEIQQEGKKRLQTADFLRGFRFAEKD